MHLRFPQGGTGMANYCANCGKGLMEKMRFCPYCGASTSAEAYAEASPPGANGSQSPLPNGFGMESSVTNTIGTGNVTESVGTAATGQFAYASSIGMAQQGKYVPDKGLREMFFRFRGRLNRKRYIFRMIIVMGLLLLVQIVAEAMKLFVTVPEALQQVHRMGSAKPFALLLTARSIGDMDLRALYVLLGVAVLILIVALVLAVAAISCHVRRLHDMDYSGWMYLVMLVPLVDLVLLLAMIFKKGTAGPNRFGPDPLG